MGAQLFSKKMEPIQDTAPKPSVKKKKNTRAKWVIYAWVACVLLVIIWAGLFMNPKPKVSADMVLNQVIDLIIESGYMKDLQFHFGQNLMITMQII